jgi:hypothetical protein
VRAKSSVREDETIDSRSLRMAVRMSWSSGFGGSVELLLILLLPRVLLVMLAEGSTWVDGSSLGSLIADVAEGLEDDGFNADADEPLIASFANSFARSLRE